MRYTIKQFNEEYPDDDTCLDTVFQNRYGDVTYCPKCGAETKFYKIKKRKAYACKHCGYQLHPLADTIFHKSETSLKLWFFAIFLFANSKNGVSAKELERHLGVTYKTAWRMAKQIRQLMKDNDGNLLGGGGKIVEADEAYIGGKLDPIDRYLNKSAVMGVVERKGKAIVVASPKASQAIVTEMIMQKVDIRSRLMTDESRLYSKVRRNFDHATIRHQKKEYVRGVVHTNTIEGFWSQLKRSIDGTYHSVSPKYLQTYVDEFVFRYNHRDVAVCPVLLERASMLSKSVV